jgi:hypothetical protein
MEMLFDQPIIGQSTYGDYFLYSVRNGDGMEYSYFAPPEVHEKLKDLKKGDIVLINKKVMQKGKKVVTDYEITPVQRMINQQDSNTELNNDSVYFQAMVDSFEEALRIQEKFNGMANVNQIAITLFIQRTKNKE